jgi:hypothetical protein
MLLCTTNSLITPICRFLPCFHMPFIHSPFWEQDMRTIYLVSCV